MRIRANFARTVLLCSALSLGGCESMNELNDWIKENPDKVKMAALGGLGGLLAAGHFTGAALPAVAAGVGGTVIGWKIGGLMYDEEKEAHAEAVKFAAEGPTEKEFAWINTTTGSEGTAKAIEDLRTTAYGDKCRKIEASIKTTDDARIEQHTVCLQKDGTWMVVG